MDLKKSLILYVVYIFSFALLCINVNADSQSEKLDRIESQVQDALIKINRMEKENKDIPSIKAGPGLKIKSGNNEIKLAGRIHYDVGMHDADEVMSCEVAIAEGGSCFTDGTNFRRLRLGFSGKYGDGFYYKTQVDWGASAKQQSTLSDSDGMNDITSVDEAFMGYKLGKNSTISLGKQKIPLSFAESTSSNDLPFIERAPSVDAMTDYTLGPKRMSVQYRNWDKKLGYLFEGAIHGSGDMTPTENFDEQLGYTGRLVYAPIHEKKHVLHLGAWYDWTDTDTGDTSMEYDYRIGLNVSDEKPIDADIGSDLGGVTEMTHYGAEIAYLYNGLWFAGEWLWGEMDRDLSPSSRFYNTTSTCSKIEANMGYAEIGYSIGGERRYTIKKGGWKRPKVKNPVNKGGSGLVELGIRQSNSSLNGLCDGYDGQGRMSNTTFGLNWQLTNNNRIMFNYILADLDGEAVDEVSSLKQGDTANGIPGLTSEDGATHTVRALGIRFQTNW